MTNTRKIVVTLASAIIALIIAASSAFLFSSIRANAATYDGSAQAHASQKMELPEKTTKLNKFAKAYTFKATGKTSKGYDWTYKTDYNNLKVKCKYDFTAHKYTFTITGTKYGLNHFTLKYKTSDTKWLSVKMTLFVDSEKYIMRTV
ncbi:MAG: hypothetical protein IJ740_00055 [Ruminococcus sp.]|nr:hypothetical protein [Ruminococcus sp.]